MCCSVLQHVAACCSVLQRVAACCIVFAAIMMQRARVCCSVLQCVEASVLIAQWSEREKERRRQMKMMAFGIAL